MTTMVGPDNGNGTHATHSVYLCSRRGQMIRGFWLRSPLVTLR